MKQFTYDEMYSEEQSHFWFIAKHAFISAAMRYINQKSLNILDVGCGTGGTTKFISKWGNVIGIEKNSHAASFAKRRKLTIKRGSAENLPFKNASFDLVTFFDVLYHKGISEPRALKEAYRVLKPGGILLITDCAVPWIWSKHDQIMDAKYRYTKKQLTTIVENERFTPRAVSYTYASIFPLVAMLRLLKKNSPMTRSIPYIPHSINAMLIQVLAWEAQLFPIIPMPIGSSILLIAQK